MSTEEEVADLKRQLAEVKDAMRAAQPKPQPSAEDQERATAKWIDEMHQMREGRMSQATPPSVVREMAGGVTRADMQDILRASHAPQGPSGHVPSTGQRSNAGGGGTGWVDPRPLSNPPGTNWVDAQMIADEVRQRAELKRKLGG
jgi:hypothetical protein